MTDKVTAIDALILVSNYVQKCRESGETDLRGILHFVRGLREAVTNGMTYAEIVSDLEEPE